MAPLAGKGKSKAKEGRLSRNSTPGSQVSASGYLSASTTAHTAYLEIPVNSLMVATNIMYDDILDRHGSSGGIPDPTHLETLVNDLKMFSQLAETRQNTCDGGMRKLSDRRKEKIEEEREFELAARDAEEKASLKRAAEDQELERGRKGGKVKKRKDRSSIREERPLTHGAHGVARQDGLSVVAKGAYFYSPEVTISITARIRNVFRAFPLAFHSLRVLCETRHYTGEGRSLVAPLAWAISLA